MLKKLLAVCITFICATPFPLLACSDAASLATLQKLESVKFLENAPTFKHAWEDKTIQLEFVNAKVNNQSAGQDCMATLKLTLPQQDLDEVNTYLDENPAKRILLGAQGYTIPESNINKVDYFYTVENGKVTSNNSGNQSLNSLHSNIEFMYQTLAQERVVLKKGVKNTVAWSEENKKAELESCKRSYQVATGDIDFACSCRVDNLSKILSPRQMELIGFIQKQPYSAATGVLNSYAYTSKEINEDCSKLSRK
ncbi:MAG TPA: hypothetical protein VK949_01980 [Methylotenera sp.]|nr:hypothetical protein [Methylotenera sp.]